MSVWQDKFQRLLSYGQPATRGQLLKPAPGQGVRDLTLWEKAPNCEILINKKLYNVGDLVKGKKVVDIGCGFGRHSKIVEEEGGEWVGVEPFKGGTHTVMGDAQNLPFRDNTFDVAIMDAVLEHIPNVEKAFSEVARVLKPSGIFIGYVAFMECFHEISYSHLSFKALEHYSTMNGMKLEKISGGGSFGTSYHLRVLLYPFPIRFIQKSIDSMIRMVIILKSSAIYLFLYLRKKFSHNESLEFAQLFFKIECLRQSSGFRYIIRKL